MTVDPPAIHVRRLDEACAEEIELVAQRMRATLVEVLGAERGAALYSMDWLRARVRWHLDPAQSRAAVYLAEGDGAVLGHTIVRVENEEDRDPIGLFSTIYVDPEARRTGVASALLDRGEAWIRAEALTVAATNTAHDNARLIGLLEKRGYRITCATDEMVRLERELAVAPRG